ncbi:hypothetical protein RF11_11346 [Thelohanellus kitauei]|uniref:Uncharacterized protein n=1 Tax=Thelohanellus kitauei TaxID=669202 RepID=A0A0C2MJW8_THEKT|nr:hypothetical protein RF11_11346 [Thelohanellus kitauei]
MEKKMGIAVPKVSCNKSPSQVKKSQLSTNSSHRQSLTYTVSRLWKLIIRQKLKFSVYSKDQPTVLISSEMRRERLDNLKETLVHISVNNGIIFMSPTLHQPLRDLKLISEGQLTLNCIPIWPKKCLFTTFVQDHESGHFEFFVSVVESAFLGFVLRSYSVANYLDPGDKMLFITISSPFLQFTSLVDHMALLDSWDSWLVIYRLLGGQ